MRKVMLFATVLSMVLATVAPAFAQAPGGDGNVQYADCRQVQAAAAAHTQASSAAIAQELGIPQEQADACLKSGDAIEDFVTGNGATASATSEDDGTRGALPSTGGVSPITLGAGALLVAGGLLIRRIAR